MVPPATVAAGLPSFAAIFAAETGGKPVSFARFMELALYHPVVGYYQRDRRRVGLAPETDFHTAVSLGPVFGELILAAVAHLLGTTDLRDWTFLEIGAEPEGGVLAGVDHPFREVRTVRRGEAPAGTGPCVLFSNELFDAQPFHRLQWRDGAWRETGVVSTSSGPAEVELPELSAAVRPYLDKLPVFPVLATYRIDLPLGAVELCRTLVQRPWTGLFLACDYGKTWRQLREDQPAGTARAYHRHRQHNNLLERPGEQDLTCDLCWDWLEAALAEAGFTDIALESQEAFLMRRAGAALERLIARPSRGPDPLKSRLQQLLHPALQGQRFQVLHARRRARPTA